MITASVTGALLMASVAAFPQSKTFDKADADKFVFEQLLANAECKSPHRSLIVNKDNLVPTREETVKILQGKSFQINSLRSDVYIDTTTGKPVFDRRYPMESAINVLMDVAGNNNRVTLTQHQYGNQKKTLATTLQAIHCALAANMDVYCNVTKIDKDVVEADLVMHNAKRNEIHLFVVKIPLEEMFRENGEISADLYANIPQNDIKNIYSKKRK